IVIDQQQPQAPARLRWRRMMLGSERESVCRYEAQPHRGAFPNGTVNLELRTVPPHHAVHHRKPQSRPALSLRGIEGLETAAARFLIHAYSCIGHFDVRG